LREGVLAATAGREANIVCDTVGGELFTAGLRALGFDGRMIVIGFAGAQIPEVRVNYLLLRNLAVLGAPLDVHFDERPQLMAQGIDLIRDYYSAGLLRPTIRSVLPFERFQDALQQAADAATPGRVVIDCISNRIPGKDIR
jgi:NADPH2:quinone reductase